MNNQGVIFAAVAGFLAVTIGAMGSHALKPHLTEYQIYIFEKGVQYHFYHALALLGVGIYQSIKGDSMLLTRANQLFLGGIVCFSGSLYLLACRELLPFGVAWAGPVTPLGGLLFMGGWACVFWFFWKKNRA
jgi:uncharacterized membrane protein YgdD (TMEM256/DUF423 family)